MYRKGNGVKQDYAERSNGPAKQPSRAMRRRSSTWAPCDNGDGVQQNYAEAVGAGCDAGTTRPSECSPWTERAQTSGLARCSKTAKTRQYLHQWSPQD